jgi:hypothetical protein
MTAIDHQRILARPSGLVEGQMSQRSPDRFRRTCGLFKKRPESAHQPVRRLVILPRGSPRQDGEGNRHR